MAQENYSEQEYDQIVNILNNIDLTLSFSEKDSGGALEYAVDVRTPNGSLGNARAPLRGGRHGFAHIPGNVLHWIFHEAGAAQHE